MANKEILIWHKFYSRNLPCTWSFVSVAVSSSPPLRPLLPNTTARRWSAESATPVYPPEPPTAVRRSAVTPTSSDPRRRSSKGCALMEYYGKKWFKLVRISPEEEGNALGTPWRRFLRSGGVSFPVTKCFGANSHVHEATALVCRRLWYSWRWTIEPFK